MTNNKFLQKSSVSKPNRGNNQTVQKCLIDFVILHSTTQKQQLGLSYLFSRNKSLTANKNNISFSAQINPSIFTSKYETQVLPRSRNQ